ncbi:ABC transporter permease [Actinocorallia longicatena]|uniref:ABC transporter permease n=1 Tax=Actinocorallia longicatena TaxID=111803 RepID=A0ABP6QLG3_9ACTN
MSALVRVLRRAWLVVLVVAAWELWTRYAEEAYFPPPSTILPALRDLWFDGPPSLLFLNETARDDFAASLGHLFGGWLLAGAAGVLVGVLIGRSTTAREVFDPVLEFLRAIPTPTLVPFFIVLFQLGATMQIMTIAFGVIWPVILNTADGVRGVDRLQLETAQVFGLGPVRRLVEIVLPAALPKIFAGLRVSLSFALILMVIAELVGSTSGIGAQLINAEHSFELPTMWAVIVFLGVLGFLFNGVLLLIERRFLGWHAGARQTAS